MTDVTDNFNRANGALGANWSAGPSFSAPAIASNQCAGGGGSAWHMAYWASASNTFSNDQHAQASYVSGAFAGVVVRHQASTSSGYVFFSSTGSGSSLYRFDSGTFNLIAGNGGANVSAGQAILLDITGSALTCSINGISVITFTDTTYTSGQPGIAVYDTSVEDDWSGGPIIIPASALKRPTRNLYFRR